MIGSLTRVLLKLPQGHCVDDHQSDDRTPERDEREIQHDRLLAGGLIGGDCVRFRLRFRIVA